MATISTIVTSIPLMTPVQFQVTGPMFRYGSKKKTITPMR